MRQRVLLLVVGVFGASFPTQGFGQGWAWGPRQGETTYAFIYQANFVNKHLFGTDEFDIGHIRTHTFGMDLGYGITDRLAVNFSIPYVVSRYKGDLPHELPIDVGDFHGTFQDFRMGVRYQAVKRGALVVTPFVTGVLPSHDYAFFAHSAVGRNLHELFAGVSAGYALDRVLPKAYVQSRYYYGKAERVLGLRPDHNNVDVNSGYFVRPTVAVHTFVSYQKSHGGLEFAEIFKAFEESLKIGQPTPLFFHHDQLDAANYLNFGGGVSFTVRGSTDISLMYLRTLWGRNGHKLDHSFNVGVGWNFSAAHLLSRLTLKKSPANTP